MTVDLGVNLDEYIGEVLDLEGGKKLSDKDVAETVVDTLFAQGHVGKDDCDEAMKIVLANVSYYR